LPNNWFGRSHYPNGRLFRYGEKANSIAFVTNSASAIDWKVEFLVEHREESPCRGDACRIKGLRLEVCDADSSVQKRFTNWYPDDIDPSSYCMVADQRRDLTVDAPGNTGQVEVVLGDKTAHRSNA